MPADAPEGAPPHDRRAVRRVRVQGTSMRPLLADGDSVRVLAGAPARCGDVVVAVGDGRLLVHRVTGRVGDRLELGGDDVSFGDPAVDRRWVLGRVIAVEGERHRRLDGAPMRLCGLAVAAIAHSRQVSGGRLPRPRPAAVSEMYLRAADAWPPPPADADRLTLLLAGPGRDGRPQSMARRLAGGAIAWTGLAQRALLAQIGPAAYVGAREILDADELPPAALEGLRRQYVGNLARWRRMAAILTAILARLDSHGIPTMAHKGVALAACVYRDPAMRIMGDADLAVPDSDLRAAWLATEDIRAELLHADPDRRSAGGFHVELDGSAHHDVDPSRHGGGRWRSAGLDWAGIWRRARPTRFAGGELLVPSPTDLLLTLIANSLRRGCSPMRTIVDIAHAVERLNDEIDWEVLEAELHRTRLLRRSWLPLGMAAEWCAVEVPAQLLEPPADLRIAAYERLMLDWKRRRPAARVPTRLLWAGSWTAAACTAASLVAEAALGPARRLHGRSAAG